MECSRIVEGTLDALVSGKRASPRHAVSLAARVKAVHGAFEGRLLDLSIDGARVAIPVTELGGTAGEPLGPAEQFGLLERHFRDAFDIHVPSCGVAMEAQVVRLVVTAEDQDSVELGCRFVQSLTDHQQKQLGLPTHVEPLPAWGESLLLHDVRWAADPARPVGGLIVDGSEGTSGPRFLGAVSAIGRRAVLVQIAGLHPEEAVSELAGPGLRVRLVRGTTALGELACEPVTARYLDTPRPSVELLLALSDALPRAVRKHFARA